MTKCLIGVVTMLMLWVAPVLAEPINITFARTGAPGSPSYQTTLYCKKLLEQRSRGRIKVTLAESEAHRQSPSAGQLVLFSLPQGIRELPRLKLLQLPFLFENREHLYRVLAADIDKKLLSGEHDSKLVPLIFWDESFRQLVSDQPLLTPEQAVGVDFQTANRQGFNLVDLFDALRRATGAKLQYTGQMGAELRLSAMHNQYADWMRHITLSSHSLTGKLVMTGRSFWQQLPEDLKIIITGALQDATPYFRELAQQEETEALRRLAEAKIEIHRLTPLQRSRWQQKAQQAYKLLLNNEDLELVKKIQNL